ncbi:MAG: hypothetical protein MJZ49_03495 [Bacteroidales bacterium]|nr:hypothetical protein [Bacteroidales bacterium]
MVSLCLLAIIDLVVGSTHNDDANLNTLMLSASILQSPTLNNKIVKITHFFDL